MDFELEKIHLEDQSHARAVAERDVAPIAAKYDRIQKFPRDTVLGFGKEGFLGIVFPKKYGGMERDYVSYAIIVEELSRKCGALGITVAAHNSLCSNHIYSQGSEAQKQKYLVPLASGKVIGAWGLTEPNAGSDASSIQTTAVPDGDGWVINGTKLFITHATECDIAVVMAVTDKSKGARGISAFVVDKSVKGWGPGSKENKLGLRSSDTAELVLKDCRVGKEHLLGNLHTGFIDTMKTLDGGRIAIAALGLGIGQGIYDEFARYIKDRSAADPAFGRDQAVQFALADVATRLEAARLLVYRAASLKSKGIQVSLQASMAKLFAAEAATYAGVVAMRVMGSDGYGPRYGVERLARDAKLCEIGEGTSEVQRMVISRQILGTK